MAYNIILTSVGVRRLVKLLVLMSMLGIVLSGCERGPAEEQIVAAIEDIQAGIQAHDSRQVVSQLTDSFMADSSSSQFDKKSIRQLMFVYFRRYPDLNILASNIDVQVNPVDPNRAQVTAMVATSGGEGLIPDSARLFQVTSVWQIEGGDWKLSTLSWE